METTIVCWGNSGIMEKKMETTMTFAVVKIPAVKQSNHQAIICCFGSPCFQYSAQVFLMLQFRTVLCFLLMLLQSHP